MGALFVFSALTKAASAGLDVVGDFQAAAADRRMGAAQRDIYNQDASLARKQAADAIALGQEAANRQSYKIRTLTGSQSAGFAGQGVSVKSAVAGQVVRSDRALGEADKQAILENAAREAAGYTAQASIYTAQGQLAFQAGQNKAKAADISAIGSLVNFAGDMGDMFAGM